ncbi:MAG: 1-acyl-sn-glycerol-3-phosphate acyltransferase [Deltaproteobacteria bacterium]|nr:1-acyl-sn-glycerol-3-phosphate acyltransferase [Deltaproteobacteria bacterium]
MSEPTDHPAAEPAAAALPSSPTAVELLSAMTPRFNLFFRWFANRFFRHFDLDDKTVEELRALESRGSVVFVMRYASRLDYFLFNELFVREGLELSRFANGIHFHNYRPLWNYLRAALGRDRGLSAAAEQARAVEQVQRLTTEGAPFFLFLRTARLRSMLAGKRNAVEQGRSELSLLEAVVARAWDGERPVHLVPLALFWKKGPRVRNRFLNLSYGATTRPSDISKVTSFLTTYRGLHVKVGDPIDLGSFIEKRRDEGRFAIARKVRRTILTFLYREEKVVEGPTLRPRSKVQELVVGTAEVEAVIVEEARRRKVSVERTRAEAAKSFREIAANMNSTFLALMNMIVVGIMNRLFVSIELTGIEKIAEYAKRHPIVLAPSHRSYFDFLILSTAFYANHLVPPHIAARENMAFGPMGFLFRRVGAFFLRRSFDEPIYKEVFRSYVSYLVREGFTQEFFIEGGRSRTGKALQPKLGLLTWDLDAFLSSARRDLFFVPIAITYERLVEEGEMVGELEGGPKSGESVLGLMRARKYLQRRFGTVHVNFGEPISLAEALGDRRGRFARSDSPEVEAELRVFVQNLGNRIVERINWAAVPNATAIAASAMLGSRTRGLFRSDLATRMQEIVDLLQLQDVRLTPALRRDVGEFSESIASLLRADLLKSSQDPRGEVFYSEESARRVLDIYRNSIVHYLAAPSFLARRLLAGPAPVDLRAELAEWLDLFYSEYYIPRGEILAAHFDAFVDHFERIGCVELCNGQLCVTEKGASRFAFLAEQTRGVVEVYSATIAAVAAFEGDMTYKGLINAATEQFQRSELLGEALCPESLNETTIENALALLVKRGILERSAEKVAKKGDIAYLRGADFGNLVALRERLAAALPAR